MQVLFTHLEPSKVMKLWAACKLGEGDYLQLMGLRQKVARKKPQMYM